MNHVWISCALSILFTLAETLTVRVLMYRPSRALNATSAQHMAPMPNFFKLALFSVTTNMPMPPTLVWFWKHSMRGGPAICGKLLYKAALLC